MVNLSQYFSIIKFQHSFLIPSAQGNISVCNIHERKSSFRKKSERSYLNIALDYFLELFIKPSNKINILQATWWHTLLKRNSPFNQKKYSRFENVTLMNGLNLRNRSLKKHIHVCSSVKSRSKQGLRLSISRNNATPAFLKKIYTMLERS